MSKSNAAGTQMLKVIFPSLPSCQPTDMVPANNSTTRDSLPERYVRWMCRASFTPRVPHTTGEQQLEKMQFPFLGATSCAPTKQTCSLYFMLEQTSRQHRSLWLHENVSPIPAAT